MANDTLIYMTPKAFRNAVKELGLNQKALAEDMGFTQETISRYANGKMVIPKIVNNYIKTLLKIRTLK